MRILALDLATKTGFAYFDGQRVESGVQDFSLRRGDSDGMRYVYFNRWLDSILSHVDLVVFEQAHNRGGFATEILNGFVTRVKEKCSLAKIDYHSEHSSSLKKFATGKGNAKKPDMVQAAYRLFPQETAGKYLGDDEADALCTLAWAMQEYSNGKERE